MVMQSPLLSGPPVAVVVSVVADDDLLRDVMALVLARAGFTIGDDATVLVQGHADRVDIAWGEANCVVLPRPVWESDLLGAVLLAGLHRG